VLLSEALFAAELPHAANSKHRLRENIIVRFRAALITRNVSTRP
jgi:hypothetical protein